MSLTQELFPDNLFVGINKNRENNLAFAIPERLKKDGSEYADYRERKKKVKKWAECSNGKKAEYLIYKNIPKEGFEISSVESRNVTDNKLFRIKVPNGNDYFQVEITAQQLFNILTVSNITIEKGVIQDKCLFDRSGALYTEEQYIETNTTFKEKVKEDKESDIPWKNVKIGDHVILSNSQKYIYCGYYYVFRSEYIYGHSRKETTFEPFKSKKRLFIDESNLILTLNCKVKEILTLEKPEHYDVDRINALLARTRVEIASRYSTNIIFVSDTKIENYTLGVKTLTQDIFDNIVKFVHGNHVEFRFLSSNNKIKELRNYRKSDTYRIYSSCGSYSVNYAKIENNMVVTSVIDSYRRGDSEEKYEPTDKVFTVTYNNKEYIILF